MTDEEQRPLALSWSGGKDSALALWVLAREQGIVPGALITTVTDVYDRVSMHGVRRSLVARQASWVGVPLVEIEIPVGCTQRGLRAAHGGRPRVGAATERRGGGVR